MLSMPPPKVRWCRATERSGEVEHVALKSNDSVEIGVDAAGAGVAVAPSIADRQIAAVDDALPD